MLRLFFVLFLLFSIPVYAQQSKGDDDYQQAKTLLGDGQQEKAIRSFQSARAEYLREKNYYRYFVATQALAIIYQDTGNGIDAERVVLDAIRNTPKTSSDQLDLHAQLQDNLAYTYLNVLNQPERALNAYSEAITYYEKAGKSNTTDIAFELANRAITLYSLSRYQPAVDDLLKAIIIYEKDAATPATDIAGYYHTLGLSYTALDEFEKAQNSLSKGLKLIENTEEKEMQAKFLNAIGNVYNTSGEYLKALDEYRKAAKINESLFGKDAAHYAQNLINIGNANKDMGDLETAMTTYQEVLAIYQQTPPDDLANLIDLFLNISRVTDHLGLYAQSQQITQEALKLATDHFGKNSLEEADVYQVMGAVAYNHAAYEESLNYNFKTISILETNSYPMNSYYAMIYNNIGQAYDELNDIDLALKYKNQAADIYRKVYGPSHTTTAMAIGNIGLSYERLNQHAKALEHLNQSLKILQNVRSDSEELGITYLDIGTISLKNSQVKFGVEFLEKARKIFDHYSKNLNKTKVYNRLALGYLMLNDFAKAERCYHEAIIANTYNFDNSDIDAIPSQPEYISAYELAVSHIGKADVTIKRGEKTALQKGLQQLDAADKVLKEKKHNLGNAHDRLELAELNTFFTEAGLLLTSKLHKLTNDPLYFEKAFYYTERSKANELLSDIQRSKATALARIPKKTLARNAELTMRINTLHQQIASAYTAKNQSLVTRLKAQEFDLTKEYTALQSEIVNASPMMAAASSKSSLPTWSEIAKTLDANTAIVSYSITDSARFVIIGNAKILAMKEIDLKPDLEKLLRGFTNQIKYQGSGLKQITDQLTDILWTPVEHAFATMGTPISKVIIIPGGPLHYLPFESLGKDKYLIEKYTISYQPSAAMMLNGHQGKVKSKPSIIAMAPVFEDKETNFVNKSCQRFVELSKKADSTSRAFSLTGEYITPLPGTKTEVQRINQLHEDKGISAKFFIEEAAHEELIKKGELQNFDYVHLATHGFVNAQYPELSGLLLTQDPKSTEDGILYTGEILGLHLNADLVTLSACETALGKKIEGEGVRGLTTAFLYAGARSVVASLWKVADESTSQLMIAFYAELLKGKNKATALQSAKLSLIKDQRYSHPFYWAPFVQVGGL